MASFRNNLAARLVADTYGLVTSLVAATITARVLGPSGRGYYASLVLLSVLFVQVFNAGLGEAVIVRVGRGETSLQRAVAATMAAIFPLSLAGALVFVVVGWFSLRAVTANEKTALVIGGLVVLFNTISTTLAWFLVSQQKIVLLAVLNIASGTTTTVAIYALVSGVHLQASGAMIASGIGCAAILLPLVGALRRDGISFKPAWAPDYLRAAVRFGAVVQLANLLVQMTGRLDLILVYRIAGSAAAGRYSVALTLGALVGSIPMAIAFTSFPVLPSVAQDEAQPYIAALFRIGVAASIACSLVLAALTPVLIPVVFGSPYRGAVAPSLLLLPSGVLWSGQWILCRAAAARGAPRSLFVSFSCSFVIMIALDALLIAPFGIVGAAAASLVSSAVGFLLAILYYAQSGGALHALVPRVGDAAKFVATVREMVGAVRSRGGAAPRADAPPVPR